MVKPAPAAPRRTPSPGRALIHAGVLLRLRAFVDFAAARLAALDVLR